MADGILHLYREMCTRFRCYVPAVALLMLAACNEPVRQQNIESDQKSSVPVFNKDSLLRYYGQRILTAARNSDFKTIAEFIHPREPLWLVPYGHIDVFSDQQLTSDGLQHNAAKNVLLVWGSRDGDDAAIKLTVKQYFNQFVYSEDFLHADSVGINKSFSHGNSLDNTAEVFPKADYIEYFVAGKKAGMEGMDWSSLRLVFALEGQKCYLLAIIHNQWTI